MNDSSKTQSKLLQIHNKRRSIFSIKLTSGTINFDSTPQIIKESNLINEEDEHYYDQPVDDLCVEGDKYRISRYNYKIDMNKYDLPNDIKVFTLEEQKRRYHLCQNARVSSELGQYHENISFRAQKNCNISDEMKVLSKRRKNIASKYNVIYKKLITKKRAKPKLKLQDLVEEPNIPKLPILKQKMKKIKNFNILRRALDRLEDKLINGCNLEHKKCSLSRSILGFYQYNSNDAESRIKHIIREGSKPKPINGNNY